MSKSIIVYEIGVDPLPVDKSEIVFFNESVSYGMFSQYYETGGTVEYMYGDLGDFKSLEEALASGLEITIDDEGVDENYNPCKITINCADEAQLLRGCKWVYIHEYLPILDENFFPFQEEGYWEAAIANGWISPKQVKCKSLDDRLYKDYEVVFNNKKFLVMRVNDYMLSYEVIG